MDRWWKKHLTSPVIGYFGKLKERRHFNRPPVFIGGCARSGTTLLLSMLSAHPNIHAISRETDAFTSWDSDGQPVREDRFYRRLLMDNVKPSAKRWCEKRPYNVRHISEILRHFGEEARFLHLVRDPRSVCTSYHPSKPHQYWVPIDRYVEDVQLGLQHLNNPQVYTLKYEDLLLQTEEVLIQVMSFLNERMSMEIEHWHQHATIRFDRAWHDSIRQVDQRRIDQWKSPTHAERVGHVMADQRVRLIMKQLNYF